MTAKPKNATEMGSAAEQATARTMLTAARNCVKVCRRLPAFWLRMRHDAAGMVTGRAPGAERRSPVPWCWTHEQPVTKCHHAGNTCRGEVIDRNDPTGDAATAWDEARRKVDRVHSLCRSVGNNVADILEELRPPEHNAPTLADLADLAHENHLADPALHCRRCAMIPPPGQPTGQWLVPMHRLTTVGDALTAPEPLCAGHMRRIGNTKAATSPEDTLAWRETGHWPGMRTGPKVTQ